MTTLFRLILAFLLPPLAVLDRGCCALFLVSFLTLAGWVPGVIAAVLIVLLDLWQRESEPARTVTVPGRAVRTVVIPDADAKLSKRGPRYLEGPDGSALEIVDDDDNGDSLHSRRSRLSGSR